MARGCHGERWRAGLHFLVRVGATGEKADSGNAEKLRSDRIRSAVIDAPLHEGGQSSTKWRGGEEVKKLVLLGATRCYWVRRIKNVQRPTSQTGNLERGVAHGRAPSAARDAMEGRPPCRPVYSVTTRMDIGFDALLTRVHVIGTRCDVIVNGGGDVALLFPSGRKARIGRIMAGQNHDRSSARLHGSGGVSPPTWLPSPHRHFIRDHQFNPLVCCRRPATAAHSD